MDPSSVSSMTILDVLKIVQSLTVTGLLVFALVGGSRKWWVWGYQLEECKEQERKWEAMALKNMLMADRGLSVADRAVQVASSVKEQ